MKRYMLSWFVLLISSTLVRECTADQILSPAPAPARARDLPKYEVIYSQKEFEIRSYSQAVWASRTRYVQFSVVGALVVGRKPLMSYFDFGNDQNVSIRNQPPVGLLESDDNNIYRLNFYLPEEYQNGSLPVPKPTSPLVKVVKLPAKKFAAVINGTDIGENAINGKIDELKKSLQGTPYQPAAANSAQFSVLLYNAAQLFNGNVFDILIWFD